MTPAEFMVRNGDRRQDTDDRDDDHEFDQREALLIPLVKYLNHLYIPSSIV